ncbi:opine metallophore biosynthesis dehydrogenase [Paenibacillus shunpengii]|uniref:Opine metallophore biosynthesis dehydrogenase n=1 Tax=Paenibacillus shunpengii TaxID=2054424 RepID=A0ABW5SM44_9BACL
MSDFNRVLICGTGPVSIQMAVFMKKQWNSRIGIAGRISARSEHFYNALSSNHQFVRADVQNELHQAMEGEIKVDELFQSYEAVTGMWDTIVLTVTTDAYGQVLQRLDAELLRHVSCILLMSPTLGSGSLVQSIMAGMKSAAEIISFSTYLGDTRWADTNPSNQVLTTAVKKKLYVGSTIPASDRVSSLCEHFTRSGVQLKRMESPIAAESRNISLYVHPPLFMNDFSLHRIFGESDIPAYVYKLFPEGPITSTLIQEMLSQWKEIMNILSSLQVEPLNLLKFMIDDNYPIRSESLAREDIEHFLELDDIHQQYLLYIRYTCLLIDPFSNPDKDGKYFDFSAVPIRKTFINKQGEWDIPRMPKEDYYRLKIIQGIARHTNNASPTIDRFVERYENMIQEIALQHPERILSNAFEVQTFAEDLKQICSSLSAVSLSS